MRNQRKFGLNGSVVGMMFAMMAQHGTAMAQTPPSDTSGSDAGDIVVTAQRFEERLDKVPMSVSVLGGEKLDRGGAQGVTEALSQVAGISASPTAQGGGTQVTVRGVGAVGPLFSGTSPVGFYFDSAPFGLVRSAIGPDAGTYDLDRIEILRGPQGVLYGAAALNGVVRILTKDPNLNEFDFKGRLSASTTKSGGENYRGDMAVNIPVIDDKLAIRAVAGHQDLSGWINNLVRSNTNDADIRNLRFKVAMQPAGDLLIVASAALTREDYGASGLSNDGYDFRPTNVDESVTSRVDLYNMKISYDFPTFNLTSMTSKLNYYNRSSLDLSGPPSPLVLSSIVQSKIFTEELALISTDNGPWKWSFGAIYRKGTDRTTQDRELRILPSPLDWFDRTKSFAAYGQVTRLLLDGRFELSAGGRYFKDRVTLDEPISFLNDPTAPGSPIAGTSDDQKFDAWTPRVVLTWHPGDDHTVYASYAHGFRSGFGQNPLVLIGAPGVPPANPDRLKNYEIGAKGKALGRLLSYDLALYYMDWRNVPSNIVVKYLAPNGQEIAVGAVFNAGSASGVGIDGSLTLRPLPGLDISAFISWNSLDRDADVVSEGVLFARKGERLNYSPKTTWGGSVNYDFPLGSGDWRGRFELAGNYVSKVLEGSPARPPFSVTDNLFYLRSRFAIEAGDNWTVSIFGENLNNEKGRVIPRPEPFGEGGIHARPRTFGLQLEYIYH